MRSRCDVAAAILGVCCLLAACGDSENTEVRAAPAASPPLQVAAISANDLPAYTANATHTDEGRRLFTWFKCAACHAVDGEGAEPTTADIDYIATAIRDGRPNGMPAFGGRITDRQIWQLAAFVRAMGVRSAQAASVH